MVGHMSRHRHHLTIAVKTFRIKHRNRNAGAILIRNSGAHRQLARLAGERQAAGNRTRRHAYTGRNRTRTHHGADLAVAIRKAAGGGQH